MVRMIFLEYAYDSWLCDGLLFILCMAISGHFVCAVVALRIESACRVE